MSDRRFYKETYEKSTSNDDGFGEFESGNGGNVNRVRSIVEEKEVKAPTWI